MLIEGGLALVGACTVNLRTSKEKYKRQGRGLGLRLTESLASFQLCRKSAGAKGRDAANVPGERHFPDRVLGVPGRGRRSWP